MGTVSIPSRVLASRFRRRAFHSLLYLFGALLTACLFVGCERQVRKRPHGDLRIGKIEDLTAAEQFYPELRLLVRYDQNGWSVMSTLCTYDLSPLRIVESKGERHFVSDYSGSEYSLDGKVLHGPTRWALPYYQAVVAPVTVGGPADTLFARIGEEVASEWRAPPLR